MFKYLNMAMGLLTFGKRSRLMVLEHSVMQRIPFVMVIQNLFWDVRMQRLATLTWTPQKTTVHAWHWTSVESAAVVALLKAIAIVTEMYWTSAESAAVVALLKAIAIVTATY